MWKKATNRNTDYTDVVKIVDGKTMSDKNVLVETKNVRFKRAAHFYTS